MAVFIAYGHLGSLQNKSDRSSTALPRMLVLMFLPGATLVQPLYDQLRLFGLVSVRDRTSLRYTLIAAAGLHLPCRQAYVNGHLMPNRNIALGDIPLVKLRHVPASWTWDSVTLNAGRCLTVLVVLAQSIASLVLVARRRQVESATLLVDSVNGIYALVAIWSSLNSLVLMVVGGKWEIREDDQGNVFIPTDSSMFAGESFIKMIVALLLLGFLPTAVLRGQRLLEFPVDVPRTASIRTQDFQPRRSVVPPPPFVWPLWKAVPSWPAVTTTVLLFLAVLAAEIRVLMRTLPLLKRKRSWDSLATVTGEAMIAPILSTIISCQLFYWYASIYELIVLSNGQEIDVWGSDQWRWSDPWSEALFVY